MVETGLERFLARGGYEGRSIALIANQTSVTTDLAYGWEALLRRGCRLRRIFSPEHGLFATAQDQAPVGRQPAVGTEVVSLYGESK
ncbi:MAG: DUF1343 domain-containing protein, partial [Spirochaetes bacterium]|nr:DUF1343 domain-containing protein [Spirochaetota bacterium]